MHSLMNRNNLKQRNHFSYCTSSTPKIFLENMHQQAKIQKENRWSDIQTERQVSKPVNNQYKIIQCLFSSYNSDAIDKEDIRKESYSFPIVNLSSETLQEAFFVPKMRKENKKYSTSSSEQESSITMNKTTESSTRNNSNTNNVNEEIYSSKESFDCISYNRKKSGRNSQCQSVQINEFNFYGKQNEYETSSMNFSQNFNQYNYNARCNRMVYVPPFSPSINSKDNNRNEERETNIKRISSMKNPFIKIPSLSTSPLPLSQSQSQSQALNMDNTEILCLNVKISDNESLIFKLNRFDDLFNTVKLFCEINKLNEQLIKPLILRSLQALNQVYQVMNFSLSNEDKLRLECIEHTFVDTKCN